MKTDKFELSLLKEKAKNLQVMFIENHAGTRFKLSKVLKKYFAKVTVCLYPDKAISAFQDYKFDLIDSDYVVSRAFKKLEEVLRISREIIGVNHKLIILKGKNAENEINKLHQPLSFIYNLERSVTDRDSKILIADVKKNL